MNSTPTLPTQTVRGLFRAPLLALLAVWALVILLPSSSAAQTPDAVIRIIEVVHEPGASMTVTFEAPTSSLDSLDVLIGETAVDFAVTSSATPPKLIFAIENSANMTSVQRAQLQAAALDLVDRVGNGVQVTIVAYGAGMQTTLPFTADRDAIASAISGLTVSGGAALYDGVEAAADLASEADGEAVIVLATYGWDWGTLSTSSREASLAAVQASGAPVYVQSLVFFGEDIAYLTSLATDGSIHNLTALPNLTSAALLLGSNDVVQQHTIQIDSSQLMLGKHQLTLTLGSESASTSVTDQGLLSVTTTASPVDGSSLSLIVATNSELAGTTLTASFNGASHPIAADGSIEVDPWQFAPGDGSIEVQALIDGQAIATGTTSITIPQLDPVLSTDTTTDSTKLIATVQAQPGTVTGLVASVDGQPITTSATTTIEVDLPIEGTVTIEARATDGTVLGSSSVTFDASPQISSEAAPAASPPYALIVGGLVSLAVLGLIAAVWRRKQTSTTSAPDVIGPVAVVKEAPPIVTPHIPVALHPVGNWEIVINRRGHDEERLPLGPGAISIGASPLCDITLGGRDIRFVHAVIGPDGPLLRIHRFGPLIMDGHAFTEEAATLMRDTTVTIGDAVVTIGSQSEQRGRSKNDAAAA